MMIEPSLRRLFAPGAAACILLLAGCGGADKPAEPDTYVPQSTQARLIESVSASELTIRAEGVGESVALASDDARRTAVWYALYGGSHPILANEAARSAFERHEEEVFRSADAYISDTSQPMGSRQEGDDRILEKEVRVHVERLSEELVRLDVIDDRVDLMAEVGRPRIAVLPDNPDREDQARPAIAMISEYLQERGFDVEVPRADEQVNEMVEQAAALEGRTDPMYQLALESGSEIYITVGVDDSSRSMGDTEVLKSSVSTVAYYTATGDQIGATTGHSPERDVSGHGVLAEEAASEAGNRITRQIENSWMEEAERGRPFKVVVVASQDSDTRTVGREVHRMMRDVCPESSRNAAGSHSFDYTLRCTDQSDAMDLLLDLEAHYAGPGVLDRTLDSGALLILSVGEGNGGGDDIIIE
ncbi:DUF6175 family protein [Aquisalimonas asiatica]|uniref:Uncharacterized protein n=1 Tax=Aquisalimonas asiatica TaxID=406100 RepID=A0A1H8VD56_9GAMM|nr:DUF6175 family protein [Aquisalimonas asiatica]SEP12798.1 hypothetical protein SAMN04488052_11138 [Aquisalimonas asiatica]